MQRDGSVDTGFVLGNELRLPAMPLVQSALDVADVLSSFVFLDWGARPVASAPAERPYPT